MLMQDLSVIAPELALVIFALGALMWGAYAGARDPSGLILWVSTGLLVVVGLWIGFQPEGARLAFGGSFVSDGFARFSKVMILFGAAATLALGHDYLVRAKLMKFEYPVLIVLAVVGMMVMVSARDLIVLYMGLELQSLALYIVAAFRRDSLRSTEAGLKYFVLGSLSSGMLLYGASLTYGFSGTTSFAGITEVIASDEHLPLGLLFGLVFLAAGMAFKVSAAPFHMWTPDVYEGSPTPVTAFFATAPKVAAAAMFARVLFDAFGGAVSEWQQILAFLSVASMFLGAFAAIGQTNIKRLMAYSSISHMGFALMGLAAGTEQGAQSLLIYLAIYVTMNVGVFAFILNMERDGKHVTDIASLGLYSQVQPARAACLAVLMFSLGGRAAAGRVLREILRADGGRRCGARLARHRRCDRERDQRVLLSAHRVPDVFRRSRAAARGTDAEPALGVSGRVGARHGVRDRQHVRHRAARRVGRRDTRSIAHDGLARSVRPGHPGRSRQHERRGAATGGSGRRGSGLDPRASSNRGAWTAGQAMDFAARQFLGDASDPAGGTAIRRGAPVVRGCAGAARRAGGGDGTA